MKEKDEHKEQYDLSADRFNVEPFEYFRVINRQLQTDENKFFETPEIKVGDFPPPFKS